MKDKRVALLIFFLFASGCGYSNRVILPYPNAQSIAVPMFKNTIPPEHMYTYVPGLETDITQSVIDGLAKDGNLQVMDSEKADLILEGEVVSYEQEPYRFNRLEQVDEFRLFIVVKLKLEDARTGSILWTEENFSGDTQYFINGPRVIQEDEAAHRAITDLAEKIVNRVVEEW